MNFFNRIQEFKKNHHERNQRKYKGELKEGQDPKILLITCSDSRILPEQLLQSKPGEVFIIRNAGNIVPAAPDVGGETATIEYALTALDIDHIIICGHSHCGAMTGKLNPTAVETMANVQTWLQHAPDPTEFPESDAEDNEEDKLLNLIKANVILQLNHIKTHPAYQTLSQKKEVRLHGWVYDFVSGTVLEYNQETDSFGHLTETTPNRDSSFLLSYIGAVTCGIGLILACLSVVNSIAPLMILSSILLMVGGSFFLMDEKTNDCQQEPCCPVEMPLV